MLSAKGIRLSAKLALASVLMPFSAAIANDDARKPSEDLSWRTPIRFEQTEENYNGYRNAMEISQDDTLVFYIEATRDRMREAVAAAWVAQGNIADSFPSFRPEIIYRLIEDKEGLARITPMYLGEAIMTQHSSDYSTLSPYALGNDAWDDVGARAFFMKADQEPSLAALDNP